MYYHKILETLVTVEFGIYIVIISDLLKKRGQIFIGPVSDFFLCDFFISEKYELHLVVLELSYPDTYCI